VARRLTPRVARTHDARPLPRLRGRILLAEDAPDNQRLLSYYLRKAGADVVVADDGRMACELATVARAAGQPFDLILMDMQMPAMDGYDASALLRRLGHREPIIAVTAHAMEGDRQRCFDVGCSDYVAKPVDRVSLLHCVQGHLRGLRHERPRRGGTGDAPIPADGPVVGALPARSHSTGVRPVLELEEEEP
jgi:CheY-like chemotaxis protein